MKMDDRLLDYYLALKSPEAGPWNSSLLNASRKSDVNKWIPHATDSNWTVRWCVNEFLAGYPDAFPQLEKTHDPDLIEATAHQAMEWLNRQSIH